MKHGTTNSTWTMAGCMLDTNSDVQIASVTNTSNAHKHFTIYFTLVNKKSCSAH